MVFRDGEGVALAPQPHDLLAAALEPLHIPERQSSAPILPATLIALDCRRERARLYLPAHLACSSNGNGDACSTPRSGGWTLCTLASSAHTFSRSDRQ